MRYEELWQQLTDRYDTGEAKAIVRYLMEIRYGLSMTDILCGKVDSLPEDELGILLSRLQQAEPVQYVTGVAEFGGLRFHVTKDVLIPRPETYELCQWVIEDVQNRSEQGRIGILDIGTGSGCIAISLARALKFAQVDALDVSRDALEVARQNAADLKVKVRFFESDMLSPQPAARYDIIVSNPPYVCWSEREAMDRNVKDYEPGQALFVPDNDPLLFYKAIAPYAAQSLERGGKLYLEINQRFGNEVKRLLQDNGFDEVRIIEDSFGKVRFAAATAL